MHYTKANTDVYTCFLDITKAFDSVDHDILMDKLARMGIPGYIVDLIKYWYSNQFVKVKYRSSLSEEWKIGNGVRQGEFYLAFFLIYILIP